MLITGGVFSVGGRSASACFLVAWPWTLGAGVPIIIRGLTIQIHTVWPGAIIGGGEAPLWCHKYNFRPVIVTRDWEAFYSFSGELNFTLPPGSLLNSDYL